MQVVYYGLLLGKLLMGGVKHQNTNGLSWFIEKNTRIRLVLDHRIIFLFLGRPGFLLGRTMMVFRAPRFRPSMTIQKEVHGKHLVVDAASVP